MDGSICMGHIGWAGLGWTGLDWAVYLLLLLLPNIGFPVLLKLVHLQGRRFALEWDGIARENGMAGRITIIGGWIQARSSIVFMYKMM